MTRIQPVVMCGGSGTRVWPESRESLPKQFIPLIGDRSTFQEIVALLSDRSVFDEPMVITNFEYRFRVAEQLKDIGAQATILLEPERRDSAAAVAAAAAWAAARDPMTVVAVLAADHVFKDGKAFAKLCAKAAVSAEAGEIVTFGSPQTTQPLVTAISTRPSRLRSIPPSGASSVSSRNQPKSVRRYSSRTGFFGIPATLFFAPT